MYLWFFIMCAVLLAGAFCCPAGNDGE